MACIWPAAWRSSLVVLKYMGWPTWGWPSSWCTARAALARDAARLRDKRRHRYRRLSRAGGAGAAREGAGRSGQVYCWASPITADTATSAAPSIKRAMARAIVFLRDHASRYCAVISSTPIAVEDRQAKPQRLCGKLPPGLSRPAAVADVPKPIRDWPLDELRTKKSIVDICRLTHGIEAARWILAEVSFPQMPAHLGRAQPPGGSVRRHGGGRHEAADRALIGRGNSTRAGGGVCRLRLTSPGN